MISFALGVLTWTFAEYVIHRGLGHRKGAKNAFSVEHLRHHATVTYFAPTWKKAAIGLSVFAITAVLAGVPFAAGFASMYGAYEWLHRRLHTHAAIASNPYGRWARRHHFQHHFARPKHNHGVTSPLWDLVFGTLDRPSVVLVPRRNALPWMLDARGELDPRFSSDFALSRAG